MSTICIYLFIRNRTLMSRLRGSEWFSLRREILERDGYECQNCTNQSNLCVHHIVPISEGGSESKSNLVTLCRRCHRAAHGERIRTTPEVVSKQTRQVPTVPEIADICKTTLHPLHQAVLMTLAKTGIGVGELSNINTVDVDLPFLSKRSWNRTEHPFIRIRYGGQIPYNNRRERVTTTYIPIDEELKYVLKRWFLVRPDPQESNSLFCSVTEWGNRLTPSMVRGIAERYNDSNKKYRTDQLTPLSFRYFFKEHFEGSPPVRAYILEGTDTERTLPEIYAVYCDSIYSLLGGGQ